MIIDQGPPKPEWTPRIILRVKREADEVERDRLKASGSEFFTSTLDSKKTHSRTSSRFDSWNTPFLPS